MVDATNNLDARKVADKAYHAKPLRYWLGGILLAIPLLTWWFDGAPWAQPGFSDREVANLKRVIWIEFSEKTHASVEAVTLTKTSMYRLEGSITLKSGNARAMKACHAWKNSGDGYVSWDCF